MPKPPNPKARTKQIVIVPKPEWEPKIQGFRELCARNGLSMSTVLFEYGIERFLREHHWPPGNSQSLLFNDNENMEKKRYQLCRYSQKKLVSGEFYCTIEGFWCIPKKCDRCIHYHQEPTE